MKRYLVSGLGFAVMMLAGCQPQAPDQPAEPGQGEAAAPSGGSGGLQFWHTQTQENDEALRAIVADFNAAHPAGPAIEPTYIGSYTDLFEKIRAFASSNNPSDLPDLAVAYESMIAEYMDANIVRPLDDLIADPANGLSEADLADFHPAYLETNRFAQFNGQMLSFPFTKSNLMLYYNQDMLDACGLQPPATWPEFIAACKAIKAKFKIIPLGAAGDPSTFDGIIMSMGGQLISDDQKDALFDSPAALETIRRSISFTGWTGLPGGRQEWPERRLRREEVRLLHPLLDRPAVPPGGHRRHHHVELDGPAGQARPRTEHGHVRRQHLHLEVDARA